MYELVKAGERTYYIDCPARVGVYMIGENRAVLIDGGSDRSAGKRLLRILTEQGWELSAIVNTHSHADHIGGNGYLQSQTGCDVFACGIEAALARYPEMEPATLYGGFPFEELRHKFLLAAESVAQDVSSPDFPKELEIIPLPGHSPEMIGLRTPDDVVFLADSVSSAATLEKYKIPYLYDAAAFLSSLDRAEKLTASLFVPAHAEASQDVRELIERNRRAVLEIGETLCELLREPVGFETLLKNLFDRCELPMSFQQYALVGSTVRSYLSWLKEKGRVHAEIRENRLLWQAL